jgi:hypothetical protein
MEARLNAQQESPTAYAEMVRLETFVRKASKLEPSLVELVRMRIPGAWWPNRNLLKYGVPSCWAVTLQKRQQRVDQPHKED